MLQILTEQDVCSLKTRDEYRNCYWDENERPIDPGYDFVAKTSRKFREWYFSGKEYGVKVTDGDITLIELTGSWMV